jgi:hypothetical protein
MTREQFLKQLRREYAGVLTERIPDDMQALIERLGDAPPSMRGDGKTG